MPFLLTRKKYKATTKPWFSRLLRHPARKQSGSILGHTHTYLLTYLLSPDPHGDVARVKKYVQTDIMLSGARPHSDRH